MVVVFTEHSWGFSPVCTRKCFCRWASWVKPLLQVEHLKGRSPLWTRKCTYTQQGQRYVSWVQCKGTQSNLDEWNEGSEQNVSSLTLRLESWPKVLLQTLHSYLILPFCFLSG